MVQNPRAPLRKKLLEQDAQGTGAPQGIRNVELIVWQRENVVRIPEESGREGALVDEAVVALKSEALNRRVGPFYDDVEALRGGTFYERNPGWIEVPSRFGAALGMEIAKRVWVPEPRNIQRLNHAPPSAEKAPLDGRDQETGKLGVPGEILGAGANGDRADVPGLAGR